MDESRILLTTMTGELYQPMRVYYEILDRASLLKGLSRIQCVQHDPAQQRWVWLFEGEARRIRFKVAHADIPKEHHPLVLGSLFLPQPGEMFIDLRSFERGIEALRFFGKHLKARVARVRDVVVVNRLFDLSGPRPSDLKAFFDRKDIPVSDPGDLLSRVQRATAGISNPIARAEAAAACIEEGARRQLPEVERFPALIHEDGGLSGLKLSLTMRQGVAIEHWLGNTNFSMLDLINRLHADPHGAD